jgi:predicted site-specific integrase-resolvase
MTKTQGKRTAKRVAIYLRVSTTEQTTTNQRRLRDQKTMSVACWKICTPV